MSEIRRIAKQNTERKAMPPAYTLWVGRRLRSHMADVQSYRDLAASGGIVDAP